MVGDPKIIRFTNGRLAVDDELVWRDLWVSGTTGKILNHQSEFFDRQAIPAKTHDLGGKIIAPGFIDVQLNGAFGFDFSVPSKRYGQDLKTLNRKLVRTGVTSYLPTLTSQKNEVYSKTLPFLAPPDTQVAEDGAESLGAHCEGPFINPARHGIHKEEVLQKPSGLVALEACYGHENLNPLAAHSPRIKMITIAVELDQSQTVVRELQNRGIIVSVGHSSATYPQAFDAVKQGATMITHLFNAMNQPHHRDTGIFGILGAQEGLRRPWFGIIADGIHVHPSMIKVAYNAHPKGCVLVTDAMAVLGLADGDYSWTNGEVIEKRGGKVTLKGTNGTIAGSCVTLIECLNNLLRWTDVSIATAIRTITFSPAAMLGLEEIKGTLKPGADADLVVLGEEKDSNGFVKLAIDEVWKSGVQVHHKFVAHAVSSLSILNATNPLRLLQTSDTLLQSFRAHLQDSLETMLPSYTHTLPLGSETGTAVAVDLGGSTLRVAVIQLLGQPESTDNDKEPQSRERVIIRRSSRVRDNVKRLRSKAFFDWIAEKVAVALEMAGEGNGHDMLMGITWSFPIEQTSLASGNVQKMGKSYELWNEISGTDLKGHFDRALRRRGLHLRISALMNDTEATLLSHAYDSPATRISLILGTGCNAAIYLPVAVISRHKFGTRPSNWIEAANSVVVNTEISMFGREVFPLCDADRQLDRDSPHPGFQPIEQLTSGRYLGEICRLTMVEGVRHGSLFDQVLPGGIEERFSLDTDLMSALEEKSIEESAKLLMELYRFSKSPTKQDITFVQSVCLAVSERAAIYLAITLFTLWRLRRDSQALTPTETEISAESSKTVVIAYCGAVVEKHPTLRFRCQEILDLLVETEVGNKETIRRRLVLEPAYDSGLLGAAVGAMMNGLNENSVPMAKL